MKLFGLEIMKSKKSVPIENPILIKDSVADAIGDVVIENVKPASTPISQIPQVKPVVLNYSQQFVYGRGQFVSPEYDLVEIGKVEDTESYVRRAFEKKEGLMFKEGFGFRGANKDTLHYVKTRMSQIARASGIPTNSLIKRLAMSLIRCSNAFLVKVRNPKASGGRTRVTIDGKKLQPIAALFPAAPETMSVELDPKSGQIVGWRHELPDGRYRDFPAADVIHFSIDKREGFLFGIPTIVPVLDDIRALRQIEENVELLLYQHLFPLFHYKVGTENAPAGHTELGSAELDIVRDEIRNMPAEGCIVTPERHEIKAIGAEGRALAAEGYLTHFKKRVLAGLGVSQVDMGDGDTTNRATAQTLSRALIDAVKAIQDDLEAQWDHQVISELLLESTFGEKVLEEEQMVHLKFHEIDIANLMEQEKHYIELFKANGITWDEFRSQLNREPIPVPEDPHDQDPVNYPEWHNTYWKLFEEPTKIISAIDEPWSVSAQAAVGNRSLGVTPQQQTAAQNTQQQQKQQELKAQTQAKVAVAKITKANRPTAKKDHFLSESFTELENDLAHRLETTIRNINSTSVDYLQGYAATWATQAASKLYTIVTNELVKGFRDHTGRSGQEDMVTLGKTQVRKRVDQYVERLARQTVSLFRRRVGNLNLTSDDSSVKIALEELHNAFESTRYRTDMIWWIEQRKAYNYGQLLGMRYLGEKGMQLKAHDDSCDACKASNGRIINPLDSDIDDIPPLHPYSRMTFTTVRNSENS